MTTEVFRWLAIAFDLGILGLSTLLFRRFTLSGLTDYPLQITLLTGVSAVLTLLYLVRWDKSRFRYVLAFFRTLAFALLTLTVPVLDLRYLPVTVSFTVLLALHASVPLFLAMEGLWLAILLPVFFVFANSNGPRSVWGFDLLLYATCAGGTVLAALGLRWVVSQLRHALERNRSLSDEIERLSHANLGFQRYASLLEQESTRAERLRLSREIHDSAGYALTTLKMLFEAAKGLIAKNPAQLDPLMDEGARVSQDALKEIRYALHELRAREEPLPEGMRLVHLLVRNFERACGIQVQLETTNTKGTYGRRVNSTLYRMVQEGMTNAFHHGRATKVAILLAEVDGNLSVRIRDNGKGSLAVKKGIGLSGMEERLAEAGGWLQYRSQDDGFEITALIPLQEES